MDAVPESVTEPTPRKRWLTVTRAVELAVVGIAVVVTIATWFIITGSAADQGQLTPAVMGLLLIFNLVPAVAVLMLVARRIAQRRAFKMLATGGGQMHVRLVAIFSLLASVPIVLTVLAASFMFQSGSQFWVSDKAREAFESSIKLVRSAQQQIIDRWVGEGTAMLADIETESKQTRVGSAAFHEYFGLNAFYRNLKEAALFSYTKDDGVNVFDTWEYPEENDKGKKKEGDFLTKVFASRVTPQLLDFVRSGKKPYVGFANNTLWLVYESKGFENSFLYVGTTVDAEFLQRQVFEAQTTIDSYKQLQTSARTLQLRFNAALFGVALLIMAITAWVALAAADRLVRPLNLLVGAARRAAEGDLGARVPEPEGRDEVATLGLAFNSMTERLQDQTNALVTANAQLESRRALIEAVMSGVSAGVISVDADHKVRLINESARALLRHADEDPVGKPLAGIAPELDAMLAGPDDEAVVQVNTAGEARTLAVKITRDEGGRVLTFDDITQQLLDQRRAAWSDVARRIAHEIKNPLTPIQLAAERLQRRYGKQNEGEKDGTFARLTETIVRQVGDLRRIVDEFSSFARMPKPIFRTESLLDIARQSMFLHEVAHPTIQFTLDAPDEPVALVCDRRQIGQALTNVVKNAVEAVEARGEGEALPQGEIVLTLAPDEDRRVILTVADNGIGLPVERDRIVEPYMTTRQRGTGLGLAIVKKIIEEHFGTIAFADRPGGGTIVSICFDTEMLANLATDADEDSADDAERRLPALTRNGPKS